MHINSISIQLKLRSVLCLSTPLSAQPITPILLIHRVDGVGGTVPGKFIINGILIRSQMKIAVAYIFFRLIQQLQK